MAISDLKVFGLRDVYIDYSFEEVTYHWNYRTREVFVKFYGANESIRPVPADGRLYNDAVLHGREITQADYEKGFARR